MTLSEELQWRGFVNQTTLADISALDKETRTFYLGVDPSAASMTIGNLAVVMMVGHFIRHGYKAVLLVGGATGMIGDPDGKKQERDLLTLEEIAKNKQGIAAQYKQVLGGLEFDVVDNYDWFKNMNYLDFLRDVGKHVPMRTMLNRDFVQSRLGEDGAGISYAEFSYSLIQGYDFVHLNKEKGCTLQICGADQWGNSIAGVDLIRRMSGQEAHVWSAPLVINKTTGVKFGKSEDGAVWLDSELTSVYSFYQFWLNVDDLGVGEYLRIYTLISPQEYDEVMQAFEADKRGRAAQKKLAYEVTKIVHGEQAAKSALAATEALFGGNYQSLQAADWDLLAKELPSVELSSESTIIEALVSSNLASSNSEARRFVEQGAVYIDGQQVTDTEWQASQLEAARAIIRRGKNANAIININQ